MGWRIADVKTLEDAIFDLKLALAREIGVKPGMTVVDMGCGQGGFTAALAKTVGQEGRVLAVDVSTEYLAEFKLRLRKYGVSDIVTFVQEDATRVKDTVSENAVDLVASYRLMEELKHCGDMPQAIEEMARTVRKGGRVCITELSMKARNEAEETYIRLHRESGDCIFEPEAILRAAERAGLADVRVQSFETDIWFSPELAKQDLQFAQVWFDADVEMSLGKLIDSFGMKYPVLLTFSGVKPQEPDRAND